MTDEDTKEPDAFLQLFGDWRDKSAPVNPSETGRQVATFLQGGDVDMTPEVAAGVRKQFALQDTYRETLEIELRRSIEEVHKRLRSRVADLAAPMSSPQEAYDHGYAAGEYTAASLCLQAFLDALNRALAETGKMA